jgi:hypothetical protein
LKNRFNPDNKQSLVWYTSSRPIKALVLGCKDGAQEGGTACLGLHTTVFQAEIYAIKACITEDIEEGYTGRNIYILSDRHAVIKALDSFKINSKLVWDRHQSLIKMTDITGPNWKGCWDKLELMEMR